MINPLFPGQRDSQTNPAYRDHSRSKRSQGSVCKLRQTHWLLFPFRLHLLQVLHPPNEPAGKTALVQFLCRFLPSAAPPSRSKNALIFTVPRGQGQVCQCDARVPVLPSSPEHFIFRLPFWKQCSLLKFPAKSHRTCWKRPRNKKQC